MAIRDSNDNVSSDAQIWVVQGMQAISTFQSLARCTASRSGLQQRRIAATAMALTCVGSSSRSSPGTFRTARPLLTLGSPAKAPTGRNVASAAARGAQTPQRSTRLYTGLLPGRQTRPPDRRLAVTSAKKISQQDFTEKAWQAIVAAPQVHTSLFAHDHPCHICGKHAKHSSSPRDASDSCMWTMCQAATRQSLARCAHREHLASRHRPTSCAGSWEVLAPGGRDRAPAGGHA